MWQVDCSHACIEESSYVLSAAESHFSLERVLQRCCKIMCPKLIYSFELQKFKNAFVKPEMHGGGGCENQTFHKAENRTCVRVPPEVASHIISHSESRKLFYFFYSMYQPVKKIRTRYTV
jgi:hypothetical protein